MSDNPKGGEDRHHRDPLGPFNAALRSHLGEFADVWMQARIRLLRKLEDRIAQATDPAELAALRLELNDAFVSEQDIEIAEAKLKKVHDIVRTVCEIKQTMHDHHASQNRH